MSADNWRVCPRCHKNWRPKIKPKYGEVTEEEYLAGQKEEEEEKKETMREDWDLLVSKGGVFEIAYRCSCTACGFNWSFKHTEKLNLE